MEKALKNPTNLPFKLWDRIEVIVGEDRDQGVYLSRIEDFNNNGLVITKPDFVGGNRLLTANAAVYVQFMRPDALYRFPARIRSLGEHAGGMLQIYDIGEMERVQRRQYVRIDMKIELKYALLKRPSSIIDLSVMKWNNSHSINISAGGLLLKVDESVKKGDLLFIKLSEYEKLSLPRLLAASCCRIVRMNDARYAGVEFILERQLSKYFSATEMAALPAPVKGFTSGVQNRLVRFVFDRQIQERQKGII
ncbi:MAG: PilZ domain-containing protein [bacterium]|jgi:c-di-GMP-binding flagellar brake protein YcgR